MPSYLQGQLRDQLRFVNLYSTPPFYYGFNTKTFDNYPGVTAADIAVLGHLTANNVPDGSIRVFGANTPKPTRVKKTVNERPTVNQVAAISTFCSSGQVREAEGSGWKVVSRLKTVSLRKSSRSVSAGAELANGGIYVYSLNRAVFDQNGTTLGLKEKESMTENQRKSTFTGTSRPKPAVVSKVNDDGSVLSTYCSTGNIETALQSGWNLVESEFTY